MTHISVFAQTNDARGNELVAFARDDDGRLTNAGSFSTGGRGDGKPHLPSQGSIAVDETAEHLIVANAGSGDLSYFRLAATPELLGRVPSGGERPVSVAIRGNDAYVLNAGSGTIVGFTLGTTLEAKPGTPRALPEGSDPAQVAVTPDGRRLIVTDRATNSILVYDVDGYDHVVYESAGITPYGFDFAGDVMIVTEAFGGEVGAAAVSSYSLTAGSLAIVSPSVKSSRSEVCWAIASADGRHAWVTNFGDGTISRYRVDADGSLRLADAVAAATVQGKKGVRDAARSSDGRFFYALDADAHRVFAFRVEEEGTLVPLGSANGLPGTVAGLAAV